jgi:predicted DNA-binding transcriptional regulator YafY
MDSGRIYELKVYGRMDTAFSLRLGQEFMVRGKRVSISDIYRDKNYLQLYGVKRYIIEVKREDGNRVIWKYFEGVDVEVTNDIE